MMKGRLFLLLAVLWPMWLFAQYNGYKDWPKEERSLTGRFLLTDEAAQLADKIMEFQLSTGAWPKNIYYPQIKADELADERRKYAEKTLGSVENNATLSEVHFLSKMYQATAQRRFRKAAEEGIKFILEAQYENGGWPLCFPAATAHDALISHAGNTQVNVLTFLSEILQKKEPYSFLSEEMRKKVQQAFDKGISCLLRTQVLQQGKPAVWCANYDENALLPCAGNKDEQTGLNAMDSAAIVMFLMGIKNPDEVVKQAVEGAVAWYETTALKEQKRENYIDKDGKRDFRLVRDVHAATLWARYYTLEDNRAFYTTDMGERLFSFEELTRERRTTYSWFTSEPQKVLRRYVQWKAKNP